MKGKHCITEEESLSAQWNGFSDENRIYNQHQCLHVNIYMKVNVYDVRVHYMKVNVYGMP